MCVRLVVRVWLPDRPGALGLVASRIGAIGADIVGVDVLERSEHVAVDEFAVTLASEDLVKLLVREIEEVDGASVEQWERVERFPDPLDALETVEHVCAADDVERSRGPAHRARPLRVQRRLGRGAARVRARGDRRRRRARSRRCLHALASGTSASPAVAAGESGPDDLAVAPLDPLRVVPARRAEPATRSGGASAVSSSRSPASPTVLDADDAHGSYQLRRRGGRVSSRPSS